LGIYPQALWANHQKRRGALVCFSRLELLAWGFIPKHFGLTIKNVGGELVCFSRLELLAWEFIPKHFGLTIKNLIIEL